MWLWGLQYSQRDKSILYRMILQPISVHSALGRSVLPGAMSLWEQDEVLGVFVPIARLKILLCRHIPSPALLNVWARLKPCVCQADMSTLNLVAFTEVSCDRWEQKGPVMPMPGLSMLQIAAYSALHQRPLQSTGMFFSFCA